ncbi:MAG: hypothetical protein LBH96_00105 [Candidatus Peribacteria bacterium]|jgi:hypothetical protein|nr:hypothetical protein [Candidatus Peribacteria bacterium]
MKSHKLEDITFIDSFKEFSKSYKQTNIIFIIIGILLEIIISIYSIRLDILKEERKIQQQIRNSGIEKTLQDYDIDIETFFTEMANEMKGEDIRISEGIRFDKASYYDNTFLMTYTFMDYTSKELDIDKLKK